ncbi:MAG: hypothetical protein ACLURV_13445 [Gallintestinimicrobium sp.]
MKRYHMIPENKNIVVGLSGEQIRLPAVCVGCAAQEAGLQLCAVHVHHGLRGRG